MIPDVGPLLALTGEPTFPKLRQPLAQIRVQAHQILNSKNIYTRPVRPVPGPFVGLLPVGFLSPVANTDLIHGACAILPAEVTLKFCNCRAPSAEPFAAEQRSHPPTLQLLDAPTITISDDALVRMGEVMTPSQPAPS